MRVEDITLSMLVAVEGAHAFSAFMPSYFTVKKFASDNDDAAKLRSGYIPAVAFNLVLGLLVSILLKKPLPLVMSAVVVIFMIMLYEGAIVGNSK